MYGSEKVNVIQLISSRDSCPEFKLCYVEITCLFSNILSSVQHNLFPAISPNEYLES